MPAGLTEFLAIVATLGTNLMTALSAIISWAFTTTEAGGLVNWPVLIPLLMMVIVFVIKTFSHVVRAIGN